jgi:C4-dicarboxylate transporter DctQ subunit
MLTVLKKFEKLLVGCETYVMVASMTIFAFCVVIDVIMRKLFGNSLEFMQELGKYLMVWATFIGASLGTKTGEHPSMSLVIDSVPKKIKALMTVLVDLICAGASAFAGWYAYQQLLLYQKMHTLTVTLWRLPVWVFYIIVPLGFLIMTVRFLIRAYTEPASILSSGKGGAAA